MPFVLQQFRANSGGFLTVWATYLILSSSWGLHLIVVRRFEYADDPKSYTSGSVATGRASHAGKVEG